MARRSPGFQLSIALPLLVLAFLSARLPASAETPPPDYSTVQAVFGRQCLDCHASKDPEGELVLENFETLMKGGELGPAIVPGKSTDSLLVRMIEGRFEREGKKKIMPPGKREKLSPEDIATIRAWIDAGAKPSTSPTEPTVIAVPNIKPKGSPRNPVNALAFSRSSKLLAVGRYSKVELYSPEDHKVLRTLEGHKGNVNALAFSADGMQLFGADGQAAVAGEVRRWSVADGKLLGAIEGHKDAIYSMALSPDGKTLATGSYDQKIKLWNPETGQEIRTLSGHNGCIHDLAFRPDGKILASASADRTVKLWDVQTGERRDTLSQALKEVFTLAFSPDGKHLYAGGADNRIRVWEISDKAAETTNPILHSKFAHEGAILRLTVSPDGNTLVSCADDRTVKFWDAKQMTERLVLEKQPDWCPAASFISADVIVLGRMDGSVQLYDSAGKPMALASPTAPAQTAQSK
jgi:sugar lactone lactonase YvrE/mono/diheme cytochrome c family protein